MKRERRVDEKGGFGRACGRDVVVLRVNVLATYLPIPFKTLPGLHGSRRGTISTCPSAAFIGRFFFFNTQQAMQTVQALSIHLNMPERAIHIQVKSDTITSKVAPYAKATMSK